MRCSESSSRCGRGAGVGDATTRQSASKPKNATSMFIMKAAGTIIITHMYMEKAAVMITDMYMEKAVTMGINTPTMRGVGMIMARRSD
jgi:hypothetical protein